MSNDLMYNDNEGNFGIYGLSQLEKKILSLSYKMPKTWWGKKIALIAKRAFLYAHAHPIVDAEIEGFKTRLYLSDNVSERKFLFMPQFFDAVERKYMEENLPQGGTFVDIGANVGIYTLFACKSIGKSGKVLAIEPNPTVLNRLKFNTSINKFSEMVITEQMAVSDDPGTFNLSIDPTNLGGSSIAVKRSEQNISISCDLLLNILKRYNIKKIDGLKIDVEGAEDKALIPFFKTAPAELFPNFIIIENSPKLWKDDLIYILQTSGYDRIHTTKMNQIWVLG